MTGSGTIFAAVPRARVVLVAAVLVLAALTEGVGLLLLVPLISAVSRSGGGGQLVADLAGWLPLAMRVEALLGIFLALIALRASLTVVRSIEVARLEREVVERLRARAAQALIRARWRASAALNQGTVLANVVTGVDRVGHGIQQLISLAASAVLLAAAFAAALVLSPRVAIVALAGGLLVVFAYTAVRRKSVALGEQVSVLYARMTGRWGETLGALRLIKSFAADERTANDLIAIDVQLTATQLRYARLLAVAQALLQVAGAALLTILVWLAIARWHVSFEILLPFVALFARALPLLGTVQQHWQQWLNARPAFVELQALVASLEAAAEPVVGVVPLTRPHRSLALSNVSVRHEGRARPALAGVNIELPVGCITALVGASGAGKSTAADVFAGLLAPDAGALTIDGRALSPPEQIAWRAQVGYLQQEPLLFDASIRENLLWADPRANDERLAQVLRDASAAFVLDLPEGLDTPVGDVGRILSGGERQRIVLARALLRDPALLILDEPTSALDPANEEVVVAAVEAMRGKRTVLVISHGGALGSLADCTLTLDGGRVVARNEPA